MNQDHKVTSGGNTSFWTDDFNHSIQFTKLDCDLVCDAVVVGGGIAGLSIAYELASKNYSVIVIEDGYIGSGESGRTTAHLTYILDRRYSELLKLHGEERAKLIARSHLEAISKIENIVATEKIDCNFEKTDGYLFLDPSDTIETLQKEYDASKLLGLTVQWKENIPSMKTNPHKSLCFPGQAQFHPLKYLKGISEAIIRKGGKIFTSTHAQEINKEGIVSSEGFKVSAKNIILATNSPVNNKIVMHLKQYAYRSYVISALVPKGSITANILWDTGDLNKDPDKPPYHFMRIQPLNDTHDVLICGGEDHPTGQATVNGVQEEERYRALTDWCKQQFEIGEITNKWSGQILYSMDGLAYLGRNPLDDKNIFITTGDSGNGMTYANIAAGLIADLIAGNENDYEEIYSPSRFSLFSSGKIFFKEVVGGFVSYIKNKDDVQEESAIIALKENDGDVFEVDGKNYGIYKDENSELHIVSAKCTHLGCTVKWNNDEKSWDCPCHGSRFNIKGEVLNGPANVPLETFEYTPALTVKKNA